MRTCPQCQSVLLPVEVLHENPDNTGLGLYRCGVCQSSYKLDIETPLEKLFAMCGNRVEFSELCLRNGLRPGQVVYLTKPEQIEGVRFVILRYGSWQSRPENFPILDAAEIAIEKRRAQMPAEEDWG